MQPAAIRKRAQREREKLRLSSVPPPAPIHPGTVTGPTAPADVTPEPAPSIPSSSATLLETEVVSGAGADAYAGPTVLGADDAGEGGVPLVTPEPAPPPRVTSPEEAKLIAKAIAKFCIFGWSELASRHHRELAPLLPPGMPVEVVIAGGASMVEESAAALAVKYNVRIPWGDELVVGLGCGVAAIGVVGKFRKSKDDPANDNAASSSSSAPPSARAAAADNAPIDVGEAPSARADNVTDAELVL